MLKKNKWNILISSFLILLPTVLGLIFWDDFRFPAGAKMMFVVWSPLILLAGQLFCLLFTLKDPKNQEQSPKIVNMVLWILPVISVFLSGMIYMIAQGSITGMTGFTFLLLGLVFAIMGNLMPKCKQNSTIGIKVKWTLQDEENWNATHRFAGKVWVIGGILFMALVFLPDKWMIAGMLAGIFVLAFIPMIYSYCYYKKQVKEGTAKIKPIVPAKQQKAALITTAIVVPLILIGVGILMFTGKVEATCGEDTLTIKATYWADMTIAYEDIEAVELREQVPGTRIYGFASAKLQLGSFENEEFGLYTRYTVGSNTCIVLKADGETIVFSGDDNAQTREIYEILVQKGAAQ